MTAAHYSLGAHVVCQKRCCRYNGGAMRARAAHAARLKAFCQVATVFHLVTHGIWPSCNSLVSCECSWCSRKHSGVCLTASNQSSWNYRTESCSIKLTLKLILQNSSFPVLLQALAPVTAPSTPPAAQPSLGVFKGRGSTTFSGGSSPDYCGVLAIASDEPIYQPEVEADGESERASSSSMQLDSTTVQQASDNRGPAEQAERQQRRQQAQPNGQQMQSDGQQVQPSGGPGTGQSGMSTGHMEGESKDAAAKKEEIRSERTTALQQGGEGEGRAAQGGLREAQGRQARGGLACERVERWGHDKYEEVLAQATSFFARRL